MRVIISLDLDFELLRKQKHELMDHAWKENSTNELLEGIISLIDAVQDQSVDSNGVDEELVFGKPEEEAV